LKYSVEIDSRQQLTEMFVPNNIQDALVTNDKRELSNLLGINQDIVCYVFSPQKERETPKDDNKPKPDDLPYPEDSMISLVG